jgi:hypothetical protein
MKQCEQDEMIFNELDRFIAKSVEDRHLDGFEHTRHGFLQFTGSDAMRRLAFEDPQKYEQLAIGFLQNLHPSECTPAEISAWVAQMRAWREAVARLPVESKEQMTKALAAQRNTRSPEPQRFEKTKGGLEAFMKSAPMAELQRQNRAAFTTASLDFAVKVPGISPIELGQLRQRLARDIEPGAIVAKSLHGFPDNMTTGQQIIAHNFGIEFTPEVWCR